MKITKQELIELKACENGLNRFITQTDNTDEPVEVSSLVEGMNYYSDLLWLAGKKLPKERIVRFACDCALINIELIKPYTDKYDMIVEFLRNPTESAANATYTATRDAYVHDDIYGDTVSAADAACCAARSATRVTEAAAGAAGAAAAYFAASAAADTGNKEKVDELLRELFA